MNMIRRSVDAERSPFQLADDSADICVQARLNVGINQRHPIFGAKDYMREKIRMRVRHFFRPSGAFLISFGTIPTAHAVGYTLTRLAALITSEQSSNSAAFPKRNNVARADDSVFSRVRFDAQSAVRLKTARRALESLSGERDAHAPSTRVS